MARKEILPHPLSKPGHEYTRKELRDYFRLLDKTLVEPGMTAKSYGRKSEELSEKIMDSIKDAKDFQKKVLRNALEGAKILHPIVARPRENGVPWIFHFEEPAYKFLESHGNLAGGAAMLHHDDFENKYVSSVLALFNHLYYGADPKKRTKYIKNEAKYARALAKCVVWDVMKITNYYRPRSQRVRLEDPNDWKKENIFNYIAQRIAAEGQYSQSMSYAAYVRVGPMKMFDRHNNIDNLPDPKKYLTTVVMAIMKALCSIELEKKTFQPMSYSTLRKIMGKGLKKIEEAYGSEYAREAFSVPAGWKKYVPFPINIFGRTEYHLSKQSFTQDDYDLKNVVKIECARHEMGWHETSNSPIDGHPIICLFLPEKQNWESLDSEPIEMQFPRWIGKGDPLNPINWYELVYPQVKDVLQNNINSAGLSFEVEPVQSELPAKWGANFHIFKLNLKEGSLVEHLRKSSDPENEYESILRSIELVARRIVLSDFEGMFSQKDIVRRLLPKIIERFDQESKWPLMQ